MGHRPCDQGEHVELPRSTKICKASLYIDLIQMLFSGKMPYSECSNELAVPIFIRENGQPEFHPPQNPEWEAFQEALNDLCKECWKEDRTERPSMDDVICRLRC